MSGTVLRHPARSAGTRSPGAARSDRLRAVVDAAVGTQRVVGTAVLVAEDGELVHECYAGWADREAGAPVQAGSVFRLASMTKPVVSAAALALVDRGAVTLDTVVHAVLPWFRPPLPDGRRPPITLRQLLTHTAGLGYGFLRPGNEPYRSAGVCDGLDRSELTLEENLRRLATVPLADEPGTAWGYSLATDVVGALVQELSGKALPDAVLELVTGPLGMSDTTFVVTDPTRLTAAYASGSAGGPARRMGESDQIPFPGAGLIHYAPPRAGDPTAFPSGGIGMSGTARDYLRFLEAVRTDGGAVLSPGSARALRTDAVAEHTVRAGPGLGWTLGCSVLRDPAPTGSPRPAGSFGWGGVYGTHSFVDPHAGLSVIALTNTALEGMLGRFTAEVEQAVYGPKG